METLEQAFRVNDLPYSDALVDFITKAASVGKNDKQRRFLIYRALAKQILHVEKVVKYDHAKVICLVYPAPLLEYIRVQYGNGKNNGPGKGTHEVSLAELASMNWK
ncbi:uncharacterized protein LOC129588690 [Paramacrobiotus metropolitanus]|uniref:uncharacterized protein LOC129588690 n=1 Tax=Paramacrobiotus metropolitanus TaxID=2943436 RepID=UPI0024460B78|nr:uncharacterized protein LOC129588690 [Paramacrobiotus metropolitanus]